MTREREPRPSPLPHPRLDRPHAECRLDANTNERREGKQHSQNPPHAVRVEKPHAHRAAKATNRMTFDRKRNGTKRVFRKLTGQRHPLRQILIIEINFLGEAIPSHQKTANQEEIRQHHIAPLALERCRRAKRKLCPLGRRLLQEERIGNLLKRAFRQQLPLAQTHLIPFLSQEYAISLPQALPDRLADLFPHDADAPTGESRPPCPTKHSDCTGAYPVRAASLPTPSAGAPSKLRAATSQKS